MHDIVRKWIVEVLEHHRQLLVIAIRQRAKFEGWLKFELATVAERYGAQSVEVESTSDEGDSSSKRSDLSFLFNGSHYDLELKTANSNWRIAGICNKTRPITKNIAGIVSDARKLSRSSGQGIVAFILFPVPPQDNRWIEYLDRISSELGIPLSEQSHCSRLSVDIGNNQSADLIVCSFAVQPSERAVALYTTAGYR